jgi:LysM repeat protein
VTATSEAPFPVVSPNAMLTEIVSGTQTAQAVGQSGAQVEQPTVEPTQAVVAPTATLAVVPTATPGRPSTYIVQKGESQYCLARRFDISPADLASLNGLSTTEYLDPGMSLKIPQSGSWDFGDRALKSHPTTYTVVSGDTIYSIACAFGDVDPNMIILANGLKDPYTLTTGQTLQIP